jgi:hypothetical protein
VSVEYHDNLRKGETWSFAVTLTASDGSALVPDAATWTLTDWAGNTVVSKGLGSGISMGGTSGNVATITIPTTDSDDLVERLHRHKLVAVKAGATNPQIHGTIGVLAPLP